MIFNAGSWKVFMRHLKLVGGYFRCLSIAMKDPFSIA